MIARIPASAIAKVLEATSLIELAKPYVKKLHRAGVQYQCLCVFHEEQTGSLTLQPKTNLYFCHGCGAAGNAIGFLMHVERLSFPAAVRELAQRAGISIDTDNTHQEKFAAMLRLEAIWFWDNCFDLGFGVEYQACLRDGKWRERYLQIRASYPSVVIRYREERDLEREYNAVLKDVLESISVAIRSSTEVQDWEQKKKDLKRDIESQPNQRGLVRIMPEAELSRLSQRLEDMEWLDYFDD